MARTTWDGIIEMLPYTEDADEAFLVDRNKGVYVLHGKVYYVIEGIERVFESACV